MTVLSPPHHPLVARALRDARTWCAGRIIDDRPALAHAVRVAVTLGQHVPHVAAELVAAALLHDAPEFAPPTVDLDAVLTVGYGTEVRRIIRALEAEHTAHTAITVHDTPVLLASTADQLVALTSLTRRARLSGNVHEFFVARPALLHLLPHFRAQQHAGTGLIPASMTTHLAAALDQLDRITATARLALR